MSDFVCLYFGPPNECTECGGFDPTGTGFCSHECGDSYAAHQARQEAERQAARAADDAYGEQVDRLRAQGHDYAEIDELLKGMP